jgi:endonuclease-3 related protein
MIRTSFATLLDRYGAQRWWPAEHAFEVMVGAVLVQRTTWCNAARAVAELRVAGLLSCAALAAAAEALVRQRIVAAGFYNTKAKRLIGLARFVDDAGGVESLGAVETGELRARLLHLDGIGPETADAILLYAFERPACVVDAYLRRWHARMSGGHVDDDGLRRRIVSALSGADELNEFHALVVIHGKQHCRSRPICEDCCLREECAHGRS